jgi:hypothetical protein
MSNREVEQDANNKKCVLDWQTRTEFWGVCPSSVMNSRTSHKLFHAFVLFARFSSKRVTWTEFEHLSKLNNRKLKTPNSDDGRCLG